MIKAIETQYKGYRFRSRLEARWAVFFDALSLKWDYEPEGFDLGSLGFYLPDFFLPDLNGGIFVEVKPHADELNKYQPIFQALHEGALKRTLLAVGIPEPRSYLLFGSPKLDPCHVEEVCFNAKYLPPRLHDKTPRLFTQPPNISFADCEEAINAARAARFEHGDAPQ